MDLSSRGKGAVEVEVDSPRITLKVEGAMLVQATLVLKLLVPQPVVPELA